jgi:hypothetical protein
MCKIGGPYIKEFLTSNVSNRNNSLRVLTQTAGAKTEMLECLVSLIGLVKLAKCFMRVSDWTWRDSPTGRDKGVGKELIKYGLDCSTCYGESRKGFWTS